MGQFNINVARLIVCWSDLFVGDEDRRCDSGRHGNENND